VGKTQKCAVADARDLDRVLKAEKDPGARALFRLHGEEVLVLEKHAAAGDLVCGMACERLRERALAGAVRSHDRVRLAGAYDEVDALQDLHAGDVRGEPAHFEQSVTHPTLPSSLSPRSF